MRKIAIAAALAASLGLALAETADAAAPRTFVSAHGSDANPCSLAMPCRSFSAAIAATQSNGEVLVLDSAGYGPVTIAKSVRIAAPSGVWAGVSVTSGIGVHVNGVGVRVTLAGLQISGQGTGIFFEAGDELRIERCTTLGMADNGIDIRAANSVTYIADTSVALSANSGLYADAYNGAVHVVVSGSRFERNQWGVFARQGAKVTLANSIVSGNTEGVRVAADNAAANFHSAVNVESTAFASNDVAVRLITTVANVRTTAMVTRSTMSNNASAATLTGASELTLASVTVDYAYIQLNGASSGLLLNSNTLYAGGIQCNGGGFILTMGNSLGILSTNGCSVNSVVSL